MHLLKNEIMTAIIILLGLEYLFPRYVFEDICYVYVIPSIYTFICENINQK